MSDDPSTTEQIHRLLRRADDVRKAAPTRRDAEVVREQLTRTLDRARDLLAHIVDEPVRLELAGAIARRFADLDREALEGMLGPSDDVAPAPTDIDDPDRVPPGQHLTAGWPVLHVGRVPVFDPETWRFTVTGLVGERLRLDWPTLRALPEADVTRDLHCVTGWSRLDNTWSGVRVRDLLDRVAVRDEATHAIITGEPAYGTNLDLDALRADDVVLAWAHDGVPLSPQHGGPLRLVVPDRYGWKSVKWAFEIRLVDRDVRGYWEERGYHDRGDPWREERFR